MEFREHNYSFFFTFFHIISPEENKSSKNSALLHQNTSKDTKTHQKSPKEKKKKNSPCKGVQTRLIQPAWQPWKATKNIARNQLPPTNITEHTQSNTAAKRKKPGRCATQQKLKASSKANRNPRNWHKKPKKKHQLNTRKQNLPAEFQILIRCAHRGGTKKRPWRAVARAEFRGVHPWVHNRA